MTARSLVLLATWARAEWCAVQIANVFGDAPLSVEWRLDAAPDVVAAAAAAVVDELPASAWPAAVEAAVRSTMAAHAPTAALGRRRRGASSTPATDAAASRRISRPRRPTRRRISRRPSPWPARTATSRAAAASAARRAPRRGRGGGGCADAAEATARTSATVESEGVVVDAAWAERGRDLVVFASAGGREVARRVPWASRERRHGAAAVAAAFARTADVGAACGAAARPAGRTCAVHVGDLRIRTLKAALGARGGAVDTAPLGAPVVEGDDASVRPGTTGFDHNEAWLVHLVLAAKAPLCAAAGADISRLAFNRLAFAFGAGDDGALEVAPT
ncbi:hypothetical protein JL721_6768 [Aureococcus anophagefferens]|nr:hypothetical protein JL721_6768 [Aureococcus anophagefferens]